MKIILNNIGRFFYKPVPSETLAFFRIAVSGFAFIQFLLLMPDWLWLYGPDGLIPWQLSDPLSTTYMPTLGDVQSLLAWLPLSANNTLFLVTIIYAFALTGLMLGFKTRSMAVFAWLMHMILNTTGHLTAYGVETFTHIALFYCIIFPVGITWSVDARNHLTIVPAYLVTLSVRILQIHLCIMYLSCGIEKASGSQWWSGEAIWIAMQQDQFHKINIDWMAAFPIIPKLLCWSTLLVEGLYPIGIYFKRTRKLWLIGIISMHAFIAIFLGLHLFGALMILLNISAFGRECFPGLFVRKSADSYREKFTRLSVSA